MPPAAKCYEKSFPPLWIGGFHPQMPSGFPSEKKGSAFDFLGWLTLFPKKLKYEHRWATGHLKRGNRQTKERSNAWSTCWLRLSPLLKRGQSKRFLSRSFQSNAKVPSKLMCSVDAKSQVWSTALSRGLSWSDLSHAPNFEAWCQLPPLNQGLGQYIYI